MFGAGFTMPAMMTDADSQVEHDMEAVKNNMAEDMKNMIISRATQDLLHPAQLNRR